MSKVLLTTLIISALVILPVLASGDVVILKNGRRYEGKVIKEGKKIVLKVKYGEMEFDASEVRRIIKEEPTTKPANDLPSPPPPPPAKKRPFSASYTTEPEMMVFLFMRILADAEAGTVSYQARQQIKYWRSAAHDRLRKVGSRWVGPKDFERHKNSFLKDLEEVRELAKKIRRIRGNDKKDLAERKRLQSAAAAKMITTAKHWTDPLLRKFLDGVANYQGSNYIAAEASFRKCRREAPLVAAFCQGHGLALLKLQKPMKALKAFTQAIRLQSSSPVALKLLRKGMEAVPGSRIRSRIFIEAKEIADSYKESRSPGLSGKKYIEWLLPGKVDQAKDNTLPVPSYDRLVFRQAVGLAVGKHSLLVDAAITKNASAIYVKIDKDTFAQARAPKISSMRGQPLLMLVTVSEYEFTAVGFDEKAKFSRDQKVTIHTLGVYPRMNSAIRSIDARVKTISSKGGISLSAALLAGDTSGPVITSDGKLVGFLAGKIDVSADGGGPNKLIAAKELAKLFQRASKKPSSSSGFGRAKREIKPKPIKGRTFIVYAIECEKLN